MFEGSATFQGLFWTPSSHRPAGIVVAVMFPFASLCRLLLALFTFASVALPVTGLGSSCTAPLGEGTAAASDPYWLQTLPRRWVFFEYPLGYLGIYQKILLEVLQRPIRPLIHTLLDETSRTMARKAMGLRTTLKQSMPPLQTVLGVVKGLANHLP